MEQDYKLKKAYETCVQMIQQRGYTIIDQDDERILADKKDGTQICLFLTNSTKFNVETIQEYISAMSKMEVSHSIIVYKNSVTPVAKRIIDESKDFTIELFHEDELQYNLTKHYLVPKHELVGSKGSIGYNKLKKEFKDINNFPILLEKDPIARFYAFKKGDLIKVTRSNGLIMYRIVR